MAYLIDTNIISYGFKQDTRIEPYKPILEKHTLFISLISVAELYFWAETRGWQRRQRQHLAQYIGQYEVLPINDQLCKLWAYTRAVSRSYGHQISPNDAWIAATALQFDLPLVTHNPKDFRPVENLRLITFA